MNQMVFREDSALISQVLWSRLRALMNEAGATLKRTAFSFPTRESNDFATVLMDVHGDSIAQSIQSIPSFLATLPLTTQSMLARLFGPGRIAVKRKVLVPIALRLHKEIHSLVAERAVEPGFGQSGISLNSF